MDFGPYLSERNVGCYNHAPMAPVQNGPQQHTPCCTNGCANNECCGHTKETYLDMFKERWNALRRDPCQYNKKTSFNPCAANQLSRSSLQAQYAPVNDICGSPPWSKGETLYQKDYKYPKSHNSIDDCCKAPCPCPEKFPELPSNVSYLCTSPPAPCPPLDDCTTYRHFYIPHDVQPRYQHPPDRYDPCECPFQECTITKSDYTKKEPIPTGPPCSQIIRHGLWSTDQMCKEFTDCTTTGDEYVKKCAEKRLPFRPCHNLRIPKCHMANESMTAGDYPRKYAEHVCYPDWISNDEYYKPETELERCTTYKHFYKPYPIPVPLQTNKVGTPDAIPFCTINKLCYSCHDPKPNQKTPVEMRDADPWPYVKREPIRYQNNLQVDPCADFCDETIYKSDYYPKALCRPNESFKPIRGYTEPTIPFNDNTTNRVSYRAYNKCEYDYALGNAGNPNGIKWGPFYCRENVDKCQPRFPAPFGHPLKPFLNPHGKCPCGPFDSRSTYNQDFRFRSPEVVADMVADMCQQPNVPQGISLSRFDYIKQGGKKAEVMPPPHSKAYRCVHPCSLQSNDTLYRIDYHDFWKTMDRPNLELYRGHPTIRTRRQPDNQNENEECADDGGEILVLQPVCHKKREKKCTTVEEARAYESNDSQVEEVNFQTPEYQRCREIPYSGKDILHRPPDGEIANGYR